MRMMEDDTGMKIVANKKAVLDKLRENRAQHIANYEEALEVYKDEILDTLKQETKRVRATDAQNLEGVYISLSAPETHQKAYDTAITMLEYHVENTMELTSAQVRSFLQDEWDWSSQFEARTMSYVGMKKR